MNKRIAIIVPGGVRSGFFDQGIPILERWLEMLSERFDLTVYSLVRANLSTKDISYNLVSSDLDHTASTYLKVWNALKELHALNKEINFDLFHGIWLSPSGLIASICSKRYNKPSVASLQGGDLARVRSISYGGSTSFIGRLRNRYVMNQLNSITALTDFQKLSIPNKHHSKTLVIPYGLHMMPGEYLARDFHSPLRIISIGNLTDVKDQFTLLEVFKKLREIMPVELKIIGPDFYNGRHQAYAEKLKLKGVSFLGFVPYTEVFDHLLEADILLHTSLHEGQGMVISEAFAAGTLVVGSKVGLIYDLVDKCCLGVEPRNVDHFVNAIMRLVNSKSLRDMHRNTALDWTKSRTLSKTVDRFEQLYNELISS